MRRFVGIAFFSFFFYALTSIYAVEKYPDTNARRTNRSRYMHYLRLLGLPMRTLPNLGRRCSVVSFAYALHTSEASQYAFRSRKRSDRCGVLQF
uniref:Putative secreted protein n=1 Tax=Ixodes ricinus TaxID=34613 RepID=A0A6B0UDN5_IXORI